MSGEGADPNTPLISVALCTHNGSEYLGHQLESVQSQTWRHIEIVAVDDASSDETWQMLQRAAAQDARLRLWRNEINIGFSANFERALSLCTGEFIAPCDQDDVWSPRKLERMLAAIGPHTLAYCDSTLIDAQGHPLGMRVSDRVRMARGSDPLAFAFWNSISGHAMLFRRELLHSALPIQGRFHDWWLAFVAASIGSIVYVDEPLVAYRQHARSQTDFSRRSGRNKDSHAKHLERVSWLRTLSGFPSPHQPLFEKMYELSRARQEQWFCPEWMGFLRTYAARLMAVNRRESFGRFALKQFFGMRWRRRLPKP